MKNLQSFHARHIMLLLVIGLTLFIYGMRGVRTSAAAPIQSGPPPCPISCQAPNGANRTIIEWAGRITAISGYFAYTAPEPTFTYRLGYTGSIGPIQIEDQRGKFYRFTIGGVESLTWCYNYTGVQLSQFSDSFAPPRSGSVDLFVDDFVNRKLEYIIYNMVGQVGYENKVLYSSPISDIFLPATPSLPDQALLDPAKWGNITYQLSTGLTGTTISGIPNISTGVFSTCPSASNLTVAMSSTAPNPTDASPIPVTAQFSASVTGFVASDIVAGNATVGNFVAVDGDTYTFDLIPNGPGVVTADIPAGAAQNTGGTPNIAAERFSRSFSVAGCDFSCQAPNGRTMTKIEWTGRINRIEGDLIITDPQPTFSFRVGYTGSIGPAKIDFGGSKFYRFSVGAGGNENLTWCYSYRGVRFTTTTESFPPAQEMTIDVHVDNFENRRLLSIQFYAVSAGATNIIDYVSPLVNTFLPETPTLPDQFLLDPAKWGGIGYTLASGQPGTNLYGIPNLSKGVFSTSACPVTGGLTVMMDSAAPNPIATSPIPVTVQFSESVTGFTASDIVVGNATLGNFTVADGDTYTFELTPLGPGLITADIPANAAQSVSTNTNNIAAPQFSRTFSPANNLPTITGATITRWQGDPSSTSPIATVGDADQAPAALMVTVNGGASATANGVTVANLINNNGEVSADVIASCDAMTATFTLRVTDSNSDFAESTLTVSVNQNPAPTLSYSNQTVALGTTPSFNPASGPSDNVGISSIGVQSVTPATGLALIVNNTSGVVKVTGATVAGSYTVVIRATDNCGAIKDASFTISVSCSTITLSPTALPNATLNVSYVQTITAAPSGTYSFAVTNGTLPAGLTLNPSTGAITGIPTAVGTFNFIVSATVGTCTGSRSYSITITCPTLAFTPLTLPAAEVGTAYHQTLDVIPSGTYNFSLISGGLPNGLTRNVMSGIISGTPTMVGTYNFTIKAQGTSGCSTTQNYTIIINCPTITVNPAILPNGTKGTAYSQTLTTTPAGGNYSYSVNIGTVPTGLNLNPTTGVLSGMPTVTGTFSFRITARGFGNCTGLRDYKVTIVNRECPTITLPSSLPNGTRSTLYTQSVAASPSGSYSYAVTAGSLPPGVMLFGSAGVLFGYPSMEGHTISPSRRQGAVAVIARVARAMR
jgi:hypothetical protein